MLVPVMRWGKTGERQAVFRESHQFCFGDSECEVSAGHPMGRWIWGQKISRAEVEILEMSAEITNEGTGMRNTQRE